MVGRRVGFREALRKNTRCHKALLGLYFGLQVSLATVTRKMLQNSAVKLNVTTIGALAKFVIEMGANNQYLDELAEHHSQSVNPTELNVSHTIFEAIVEKIPAEFILIRLGLSCAVFTSEKVEHRVRPMPDVARCFSTNDFSAIGKQTDLRSMRIT